MVENNGCLYFYSVCCVNIFSINLNSIFVIRNPSVCLNNVESNRVTQNMKNENSICVVPSLQISFNFIASIVVGSHLLIQFFSSIFKITVGFIVSADNSLLGKTIKCDHHVSCFVSFFSLTILLA